MSEPFLKVPVEWIEEPERLTYWIGDHDETTVRFIALALARLESSPRPGFTIRGLAHFLRHSEPTARKRIQPAVTAGLVAVHRRPSGKGRPTQFYRLTEMGRGLTINAVREFWMLPYARINALPRPTPLALVLEAALLDAERRGKTLAPRELRDKANCRYDAAESHLRRRPDAEHELAPARPPGLHVEPPAGADVEAVKEQLRGSAAYCPGDVALIVAGEEIARVEPAGDLFAEIQHFLGCKATLFQ